MEIKSFCNLIQPVIIENAQNVSFCQIIEAHVVQVSYKFTKNPRIK